MKASLFSILAISILGMALAGCGDSEVGAAPVVKVTPEQRAKDVNDKAESTVKWLEGIAPADRQAAIGRAPQISASLKEATDPAIQARISALGITLK